MTEEQRAAAKMTLEDFIHYCASLNLAGTELTSYYFPKDVTTEYLLSVKELCFRLGLDISGTAIGNDFCLPDGEARDAQLQMTREWIDHAAVLGAPVIRIFAGLTMFAGLLVFLFNLKKTFELSRIAAPRPSAKPVIA